MSNIETPSTTTDEIPNPTVELGDALARRIANSTPSNDGSDTTQDDASSPASTDSTTEGEVAAAPVVPIDAPVTGSEGATSTTATGADDDGDDTETSAVPSPSTFTVGERTYTTADVERLSALGDWATALDPNLRNAMAALEAGQAAAISLDEYQRFQAWQAAQASRTQQPPTDELLSDLDDQQRLYVENLQRENIRLTAQQQNITTPPVDRDALQRQMDAQVHAFNRASLAWADEHGLTPEQTTELTNIAIEHHMFDAFAQQERDYHPVNGTLIRDADMASVTRKALNYALATDPGLYTQVMTGAASAAQRAAADMAADQAISQKKARAASMATSASQASITPPIDVTKMTPDERRSSMSAFIAQAEGIPQHD